jgi:hypothetical protein
VSIATSSTAVSPRAYIRAVPALFISRIAHNFRLIAAFASRSITKPQDYFGGYQEQICTTHIGYAGIWIVHLCILASKVEIVLDMKKHNTSFRIFVKQIHRFDNGASD